MLFFGRENRSGVGITNVRIQVAQTRNDRGQILFLLVGDDFAFDGVGTNNKRTALCALIWHQLFAAAFVGDDDLPCVFSARNKRSAGRFTAESGSETSAVVSDDSFSVGIEIAGVSVTELKKPFN